ncbi:MAG: histidine ammonia-lyase [Bdellovibrionales bacterium]
MIELNGENMNLETLWRIAHGNEPVQMASGARARVSDSRGYIESRLDAGEVIYGVNTGFGAFSSVKISPADIVQLQKNLIRSHSSGVGDSFSIPQSRAIMALRANALIRGHSGIRPEVIDKILEFLNQNVIPVIPQQGSVGASGDLAPLSHLALALIGEGHVWQNGKEESTSKVLASLKIAPLELKAKEGLSLINGCQVMTAVGLLALYEARRLLLLMDLAGGMSLEALKGSRKAFDPLIAATRPHPGEAKTARNMLKILGSTSPISESHVNCTKVQDSYSLRCMPAVHGAAKDAIRQCLGTLEVEANSSTDNPLVFAKEGKILSCGNFHGEPVAFAMDFAAIAMSAAASISECRIEKLINPAMSDLPAFLAPNGGLNSGHMIVQVAAAALVSENKILAHPASVDSIPTSADKEDHVSMGTIAARKFLQVTRNAENIVAMEFLSATQALDLLEHSSSGTVKAAHDLIRETVPFAREDRVFADDIAEIRNLIRADRLSAVLQKTAGELEW